jgi:molybdenum cofactor guanylyltransferase
LAAAEGELVLVAACDMPWLVPEVLRLLLGEAHRHPEVDAVALRTGRGPEPLLCVYRRRVLPTVS